MNKPLIITISLVIVAVVGYVVYSSYSVVNPNEESADNIINKSNTQPSSIPVTDEQRIKVLESLNASANASKDEGTSPEEAERIKKLESMSSETTATSPPANGGTSASEAERIKLLESLRK